LETFWLKPDPAVASRIIKPQRILMLNVQYMTQLRAVAHRFCASIRIDAQLLGAAVKKLRGQFAQ
jgi:hypothetical protein